MASAVTDYRELRAASAFSFLRGSSLPEDLVAEAARLGQPVLALGDRDGLSGAPRFFRAARESGVRPLVGAELSREAGTTLYVLVESREGYRNLCRFLTQAKLRAPKGEARVLDDDLESHTEGLLCLAGGPEGPLAIAAARGDQEAASRILDDLRVLFRGRVWIDLQRHLDPDEERRNRFLADFAGARKIPLLVTNDVRHATPAGRDLLDVLTCIRQKTTLDRAGRRLVRNAERHLKRPDEMARLFADLPGAIRNTREVAERCEFTLADLGYRFPDCPLPAGETPDGHLRRLSFEGARRRYGRITPKVRCQIEHELAIIARLGLAGYFLIVHDIVDFCRRERILAQGRGSAANSAVCYALGITAVDAVGMDLLFERFLSEERGEWPDIDIDLPSGDQREKVIQYVYAKYGPRGAGMTANVITYRTRSAVREVGKALGLPADAVDRLSKSLRAHGYRDDLDEVAAQIRSAGFDPTSPRIRHLVRLVNGIEGLPRHLGQHSGGMVIAAGRLDEVVPLEPARMEGRVIIQWDKDDCADLGIIKVDLLGLGMMAVLEDALPLVREHEGLELDLGRLPADDPEVYAALQRADTVGVFQVESRAQMATLPRLKPKCFYDLVVEVAIIRPGPIVGQMVHPYLARRAGREPVTYPHPSLEPILERTLGVPLFQEQLLRMAVAVAGFTPGEAEELRRAMGFKRSIERMESMEKRLYEGMDRNGITGEPAEAIVKNITSFALYGFPESHAASFALLAYASAYLKVRHPAAFLCALLNAWPMGFYHPATLVKDAQRHGVKVLPIDVTRSGWSCSLERVVSNGREPGATISGADEDGDASPDASALAVRLGLRYVRGLREEAAREIEEERTHRAFRSLQDLARRTSLRRDELDALAHVGGFGGLGPGRRQALWQVSALETDRRSLLARIEEPLAGASPLAEMSRVEETLADYATSGMTAGPHLLEHLRAGLVGRGILSCREVREAASGRRVRVAGHVIVRQRPGTAKGFLFLTLEDETGTSNAVVTPDVYQRHRRLLHTTPLLVVEGSVQNVEGVVHVRARSFEAIPQDRGQTRPKGGSVPAPASRAERSHDFR